MASDVIPGRFVGPIVPDKCVKFRVPLFNRSGEIQPKTVRCGIFGRFSNFDNCRPEVAGNVISGAALVHVGVDVPTKLGDYRWPNHQLFPRPDPFHAVLRSIQLHFYSRPEVASDAKSSRFVWPVVADKCAKFRVIPAEAVGGGIFDSFCHNF